MKPDLHMHTTSSDGVLSPGELVKKAVSCSVTIMAITDHDSLDGVDSLRDVQTEIPVLVGTELSMRDMHGLHLLGYGRGEAPELRAKLHELADMRQNRARRIVEKLTALGMPLDYDQLRAGCSGTMGRMHIARAMLAHGYVRTAQEAFDRWIGEDGPAYVDGDRLKMAEALPLLRRNGFIPVLAHPAELSVNDVTLRMLLDTWQKQGLMGVEVYHPAQAGKGFGALDAMVRRMGLLVTGGSDFHADNDGKHGQPGSTAVHWRSAREDLEALQAAMQNADKL